jgi:hypothetical protein
MSNEEKWHKPTDKDKLQDAHEYFNLPKVTRRKKRLDWWDKVKIAIYEKDKTKDAEFEIIEPKQLPEPQ